MELIEAKKDGNSKIIIGKEAKTFCTDNVKIYCSNISLGQNSTLTLIDTFIKDCNIILAPNTNCQIGQSVIKHTRLMTGYDQSKIIIGNNNLIYESIVGSHDFLQIGDYNIFARCRVTNSCGRNSDSNIRKKSLEQMIKNGDGILLLDDQKPRTAKLIIGNGCYFCSGTNIEIVKNPEKEMIIGNNVRSGSNTIIKNSVESESFICGVSGAIK